MSASAGLDGTSGNGRGFDGSSAPAADPAVKAAAEFARSHRLVPSSAELLANAFRHTSWCSENPQFESNERLEFLGDAVLSMLVAERLYLRFPDRPEGDLAKARAQVVDTATLASLGKELGLGSLLVLGRGEEVSGGRAKPSILAAAVEAVIGAVYLSCGLEEARRLVLSWLGDAIERAGANPGGRDYKTRLQEQTARIYDSRPVYEVEGHGPDHQKRFVAKVSVAGRLLGEGEGRSKKEAQQQAAREALERLEAAGDATDPGANHSDHGEFADA